MSTNRTNIQTVLIGKGPRLSNLLGALASNSGLLNITISAVVEPGAASNATALEHARATGIPLVTSDMEDVLALPDLQLVILVSLDPELTDILHKRLPTHVTMLRDDMAGFVDGLIHLANDNRALSADSRRLKETRLRLNQFVETANMAIYIKDPDLRYRRVNAHALHLLGMQDEEVIGKTDRSLYPDGRARWLQKVEQETLRTGSTLHVSGVLPMQGQDMHVQVTLFPIIENGKTEGLYGLIEDTTELFESEQKLHEVDEQLTETQKYLREVLENSRDIIFLVDTDGKLLSFNKGAENALGYRPEEVVGMPAENLCADGLGFQRLFKIALKEGHATKYEAEFMSKDQDSVISNISLTLIEGPDGKPLEVVCLCRDITTRLRLKNDLIRSERLAAVGQMASGVAHEINNPLAVIDTIAGLIEETLADEGHLLPDGTRSLLGKAVGRLHHQVTRCTSITHSLLGFVRKSESGMGEVEISELLDECLNLLGSELRRSRTKIHLNYCTDQAELVSDRMLLEQVFVNLIKNAVDAIEEVPGRVGLIELSTHCDGKRVMVTVQDNGIGIAEEDQEKIFDLFHTTKAVGKGTGLGLSIVHDILHRLGGSIRLASQPGQWTRFMVELPLQPPTALLPDPSSVNI